MEHEFTEQCVILHLTLIYIQKHTFVSLHKCARPLFKYREVPTISAMHDATSLTNIFPPQVQYHHVNTKIRAFIIHFIMGKTIDYY